MEAYLEMRNISKTFPGVKALDRVNLLIAKGEVHALCGENGAGKSTLMKILTGVFPADPGGTIWIQGRAVEIHNLAHARALGISIIYQELSTVENLSVAENIFLAKEPIGRTGFVDRRQMNGAAKEMLRELHLDIDPDTLVAELSVGHQQMIEIAKAISYDATIIVMDEPTASLSQNETETLIDIIRKLKQRNIGIVYITHRLDEIFEIADRVTVLRDGRTIDSLPIAEVTREVLVRKMVDRELSQLYGEYHSHSTDKVVMSVRGLTLKQVAAHTAKVADISFDLHQGEILGVFGLMGAGRTEIMETIFGVRAYDGEIRMDGKLLQIHDPASAMANGIGFVTEDRKAQGLVLGMKVRENFSLTHLEKYCRLEFVNQSREGERCREFVRSLAIKTHSIEQQVVNLSGGNQQKVVIAKWVARHLRVLIVDEPTRGIDVGAKAEVHALLARLAEQGLGVIVVSSDLPEVLAISDRVLVIREGRIGGTLSRGEATRERVMHAATG
jgi:ABC-type sugar transport system ATPase subunit